MSGFRTFLVMTALIVGLSSVPLLALNWSSAWWLAPTVAAGWLMAVSGVVWRKLSEAARRDRLVRGVVLRACEDGVDSLVLSSVVLVYQSDEEVTRAWVRAEAKAREAIAARDLEWMNRYLRGEASDF